MSQSAPDTNPDDGRMHVLCASDRAYGPWLGVMLTSLLEIDHGRPLSIYVLSDRIRDADLNKIIALCTQHNAILNIRDVSVLLASDGKDFHISQYISKAAYARIYFDRVFSELPARMLYLDSDIVCLGSLRSLWEIGLSGAAVGATPDLACRNTARVAEINERLGLEATNTYFNSGVLLIDCVQWQKQGIGARLEKHITQMGSRLGGHDQDALNSLLAGGIRELSAIWNFQAGREARPDGSEVLIHFIGTRKPWDTDCPSPLAKHYLAVKARSSWQGTMMFPYRVRRLAISYRKRMTRLRKLFGRK